MPMARLSAQREKLYDLITGDEDARVCRGIPSDACDDQPHNFFAYLGANSLSKVADELSSARLVLPWLLGALGAPAAFTGFLVPIRESGVLLPQCSWRNSGPPETRLDWVCWWWRAAWRA